MKTAAQRAAKRVAREKRSAKEGTWFCAGCKARHLLSERCPTPRLFAKGFNRVAPETSA